MDEELEGLEQNYMDYFHVFDNTEQELDNIKDDTYQPMRKLIKEQRIAHRKWTDILNYPREGISLSDFLQSGKMFFPNLNEVTWQALVNSQLRSEYRELVQVNQSISATILGRGDDNELEIPTETGSTWKLYSNKLINEKGFDESTVSVIEAANYSILKRLNGNTDKDNPVKGLVIGNIQSGKTANMAALMAMAADNGWNFFIILSGTIENLRKQTETRLYEDLHNDNCNKDWCILRRLGSNHEIGNRLAELNLIGNKVYFTVCLKNATRLRQLLQWLLVDRGQLLNLRIMIIDDESDQASINSNPIEDQEHITAVNNIIRGLVYCDGTDRGLDEVPNNMDNYRYCAMNYIGYTGTPYANILNEPPRTHQSLYPSSFITTLSAPLEYFGPQQIFGTEQNGYNGLNIVRVINNKEIDEDDEKQCPDLVQIKNIHDGISLELPQSMIDAIAWFICCVACQRFWQSTKPVSMLIHTSRLTREHDLIAKAISEWFINNDTNKIIEICHTIWDIETNKFTKEDFKEQLVNYLNVDNIRDYPSFDNIEPFIRKLIDTVPHRIELSSQEQPNFTESIHLCIDNATHNHISTEEDDEGNEINTYGRLLYPSKENQPNYATAFIVIGGQTLARGLTLEGLVSSYFIRKVNYADTLMQMGRWFGYRKGYELLPRIWITNRVNLQFQFLSKLDLELREEVLKMEQQGKDPTEYAVRLCNTPDTKLIRIAALNRMQAAHEAEWNFSGQTHQTYLFENNQNDLRENIENTRYFISRLGKPEKLNDFTYDLVWTNVNPSSVKDYFSSFHFAKRCNLYRLANPLANWVEQNINDRKLQNWHVVVASLRANNGNLWNITDRLSVTKVSRSKFKKEGNDKILNIGTLRAPADLYADVNFNNLSQTIQQEIISEKGDPKKIDILRNKAGLGTVPLLIIYNIDKDSEVDRNETSSAKREKLNAIEDLIGICIYTPGESRGTNLSTRLAINFDYQGAEE